MDKKLKMINIRLYLSLFIFCLPLFIVGFGTVHASNISIVNEQFDSKTFWYETNNTSGNMIEIAPAGELHMKTAGSTSELSLAKYRASGNGNGKYYFNTDVIQNYVLEAKLKVDHFLNGGIANGKSAELTVCDGVYKVSIDFESSGIYVLDNTQNWTKKLNVLIDNNYHIYRVEVNNGNANVYMDNVMQFTFSLSADSSTDDLKISAQGTAADSSEFHVDYIKLDKVYADDILMDEVSDSRKMYSYDNIDFTSRDLNGTVNYCYGMLNQIDMTVYNNSSKSGSIVYKIPDGAILTGFEFNVRVLSTNQGAVTAALSSDGTNWNSYNVSSSGLLRTAFYASGNEGFRFTYKPSATMLANFSGKKYFKIMLGMGNAGSGGVATADVPALMRVEITYATPHITGVRIGRQTVDPTAASVTDVPVNVQNIELSFNMDMDSTVLNENNIKLVNGTQNVPYDSTYQSATRTYVIKPSSPLNYSAQYQLIVAGGINTPLNLNILTPESDFRESNVRFNGNGDQVSVSLNVKNNSVSDSPVTLLIISYKDGSMLDYNYFQDRIDAGETKNLTTPAISKSSGDSVKAYVLNDMIQEIPLCMPSVMDN